MIIRLMMMMMMTVETFPRLMQPCGTRTMRVPVAEDVELGERCMEAPGCEGADEGRQECREHKA